MQSEIIYEIIRGSMQTIHDKGYKKLFSNKVIFRQLIETFVHEDWVKDLDFDNCETLDKSFISSHYKETESDIIYKINLRDKEAYIFILIEFQSSVDHFMALRILNYVTNFYMDYLESKDFIGNKGTKAQALQWPRVGAVLNGYALDSDEMPVILLEAQMEIAISIDAGTNPMANLARETKREKVGDIDVEYTDNAFAQTFLQAAETKLNRLVKPIGMAYRV